MGYFVCFFIQIFQKEALRNVTKDQLKEITKKFRNEGSEKDIKELAEKLNCSQLDDVTNQVRYFRIILRDK